MSFPKYIVKENRSQVTSSSLKGLRQIEFLDIKQRKVIEKTLIVEEGKMT